ncbi:EamA family transporter [Streptomyces sp. NBC_01343]|uniref:EamA family transporter n=1 Tax=Streptomyces sp. NBC_01343 TaxID=2903832 RepID=UPI002E15C7B8|nr:EamA family transporter [Streptomyces sp. NBC_01343]
MRPVHTALAVLVAAVWGFNFVVIEIGLGHFPPLLLSALRFLVAALPAVFFVGRPKAAWKWIIAVGVALGIAKFGLLFTGMAAGMPAGLSSLVLQVQSVFTAVLASLVLRERPGRVRIAGMAVALAGIAVAAVEEGTSGPVLGFTLVVAAAACWGVSNVLTRKASPPDALNFMVWVCTVPVLPLFALSLLLEGPERDLAALRGLDWSGVAVIAYVAWVSTVFGFGAWNHLLKRYPASSVAPFSLLVPVFGMSSAALVLGEGVSGPRWVAALLLVGGVGMTSLAPARAGARTKAVGDGGAAGGAAAGGAAAVSAGSPPAAAAASPAP